jgi:hypothetical protein
MKTFLGGVAAIVVGAILLVVWIEDFFQVLAGIVPVMLLLGGGLAAYLGYDELNLKKEKDGEEEKKEEKEDKAQKEEK